MVFTSRRHPPKVPAVEDERPIIVVLRTHLSRGEDVWKLSVSPYGHPRHPVTASHAPQRWHGIKTRGPPNLEEFSVRDGTRSLFRCARRGLSPHLAHCRVLSLERG